jgi:uncharacterized membrane protein YhaH (DUF805 family)
MTEPSWPWRLFRFKGRATRREYWSVILPVLAVGLTYVVSDQVRRVPGEPWDFFGLIGLIGFFTSIAAGACVMGRRFADLGRSPLEVKLFAIGCLAVGGVTHSMKGSLPMSDIIGTGVFIAAIALVGLVRGLPEDGGSDHDPQGGGRRDA